MSELLPGECRIALRDPYDQSRERDPVLDRASDIVCVLTQGLKLEDAKKHPAWLLFDRMYVRRLNGLLSRF